MISPWKILSVILILYAIIGGLLMPVPELPILEQSIRNLYYHVPMWFSMVLLLLASAIQAVSVLRGKGLESDAKSNIYATVGMLYGTIGIITGMIWAKNTWGAYWVSDPKLNSAAIGMLIAALNRGSRCYNFPRRSHPSRPGGLVSELLASER